MVGGVGGEERGEGEGKGMGEVEKRGKGRGEREAGWGKGGSRGGEGSVILVHLQLSLFVISPPPLPLLSLSLPTDMAVPALARFGSDHLKETFLAPTIAGDVVVCLGVSEAGAGSDVASIKTTAKPKNGEPSKYN